MNLFKFKLDTYNIYMKKINLNYNHLEINIDKKKISINFIRFKKFLLDYIYKSFNTIKKENIYDEIYNLLEIKKLVKTHNNINNILDQIIIILINNFLFIKKPINYEQKKKIYKNLQPINNFKIKLIYILLFHLEKINYFYLLTPNTNIFSFNKNNENELLWLYDNL